MTAVPAKFVTTRELSILHSHNLLSRWMWSCFVCVFVCFVLSVYLWHVLCLHCFYHTSCTVMTISRCTHPFLVWAEHWGAGFSPNFAQSRKQSTVIEEDIQSKCATLRICRWFWVVHCASFVAVYCMTSRFQIRKPGSSWQDRRLSLGVFVWILQTLFFFSDIPTLVVAGCWAISNVAKYTVFLADDTSRGDTGPGQLFVAWKLSWMWDWVSWCCWDVEWMDRDVRVPCSGLGWFFKHHSSSWFMSVLRSDQSVCLFKVGTARACSISWAWRAECVLDSLIE